MMNQDTARKDLGAVISRTIRTAILQMEICIPAKAVSVDRLAGRVAVQPMIQMGTYNGEKISRAIVHDIPILTMGGGGFFLSYPVEVDDFGFLFSSDRDTSLFYSSEGGEDWPNTERIFNFSDGGFLPLKLFDFSIAGGVEKDGVSLQSNDGETFFTMKKDEIQINAKNVKIIGDLEHTGNSTLTGDLSAKNIEASANVKGKELFAGALAFSTHIHPVTAIGTPTGEPEGPQALK